MQLLADTVIIDWQQSEDTSSLRRSIARQYDSQDRTMKVEAESRHLLQAPAG